MNTSALLYFQRKSPWFIYYSRPSYFLGFTGEIDEMLHLINVINSLPIKKIDFNK